MPMVPHRRAPRETDRQRVRPLEQPPRTFGRGVATCFGVVLLVVAIAAMPPVHAEPIALAPSDAEPRVAGAEVPFSAHSETPLGDRSDETAIAVDPPPAATSAGAELGDTPLPASTRRPTASVDTRAPQLHSVPGRPMKDAWPDSGVRRPAPPLTVAENELAAEDADWEREIKEAIRPIYDDLAARGIIDAVQGIRSYLSMLGVLLSSDSSPPAGDRTRGGSVAESRVGGTDAGWETQIGRADVLMPGKSGAQAERERLIAALLVREWIDAALPWIYGLAALVVAWQIGKVTFALMGARATRAQRRATRSRHRSADSARTRARS